MRTLSYCLLLAWLLQSAGYPATAQAREWPDPTVLETAVNDALKGKQVHLEPVETPDVEAPPSVRLPVAAGSLGGFFELLAYVLLAAGVVLLVTVILQKMGILDRGARPPVAEEVVEIGGADPVARRVPDVAVAAAARGDFGEALRLLLGEVLPRFYTGRGDGWPEAWTSRQCLRRVARAEPAREQLTGLIGAVERHHFGGLPAGRSDWEQWARRADDLQPSPAVEGTP